MRATRRRRRRSSAARLGNEGRHAGEVSKNVILRCGRSEPRRMTSRSASTVALRGPLRGHLSVTETRVLPLPSDLPDSGCVCYHARTDHELALHEDDRARAPHDFAMRFDEFAKPHRADELDIQLDRGMRLVAG